MHKSKHTHRHKRRDKHEDCHNHNHMDDLSRLATSLSSSPGVVL